MYYKNTYSVLQKSVLQKLKGGVILHTLFLHITKGGTGKSLSTYQLAWVMGELFEKRVLVVDLDPQANISFLLGVNGNDIIKSGGFTIAHCLSKDLNAIFDENTKFAFKGHIT